MSPHNTGALAQVALVARAAFLAASAGACGKSVRGSRRLRLCGAWARDRGVDLVAGILLDFVSHYRIGPIGRPSRVTRRLAWVDGP